jgi:putative phosphoesterase
MAPRSFSRYKDSLITKEAVITRIAALSDIHGNLPALEAAVADLKRRNIDLVMTLGDQASGPLWPRETTEFLMQQKSWIQIAGNHERQLTRSDPATLGASDRYAYEQLTPEQMQWLKELPATANMGNEIVSFHGTPASDSIYLTETVEAEQLRLASPTEIARRLTGKKAPVMLCGHSHLPRLVRLEDDVLIVNPGSIGLQAYQDDQQPKHIVQTGSPEARYAILEKHASSWVVEFIVVPYDHQRAATQARQNQRNDWEVALRTGFMVSRENAE